MTWQQEYLERYYRSNPDWIDGTSEFHELIHASIPSGSRILEIGAGPTNKTSQMLAGIGEVHGLDPDPDVRTNDALTSAEVLEGDAYPYEDASFDACVSDYVVEHVADPDRHLAEVARVLRPGAPYVFRTPNRWHYVYVVSSVTPHWFHEKVANRLRNMPPEAHDPYPTVYAMNSPRRVRELAGAHGLAVDTLRTIEKEPSYGMAAKPLFLTFMLYERFVNSSDRLGGMRANILAVLRRSGA